MTKPDDFQWWKDALAGKRGPVHDGEPQSGFYRGKNKEKQLEAYAYWKDSATGAQRCHRNGKELEESRAMHAWLFVNAHPITEAVYWHFIDTGKWTDSDEGTAAAIKSGPAIDPAADPVGSLKAEIETAAADVSKYTKIESDEAAARAQTLRSNLTTYKGKAEKLHGAEKAPHLEAGRAVDAKWFPLRDLADNESKKIKKALEAWNDVKLAAAQAAARETERLAREAQEEADRIAREHAEAVRKAAEANKPPPPEPAKPAPAPVAVASNAPAPSTQIKGASGRAASVTAKPVVHIDDEAAVYKFLAGDPDLTAFLLNVAQKKTDAGITVPGTHTELKSVVR